MEIEILEDKENSLLGRREIGFKVSFEAGVPRFRKIREEIVKKIKTDEKLTILNGLKTEFGKKSLECFVKVYKDEDSMKVEPEFRIKKNFTVKEEKKKPAEGESAPAPVEGENAEKPVEGEKAPAGEKKEKEEEKIAEKPAEEAPKTEKVPKAAEDVPKSPEGKTPEVADAPKGEAKSPKGKEAPKEAEEKKE